MMKRALRVVTVVAAAGWLVAVALVGHKVVAPGDQWSGPLMALALALAGTASLCVAMAHAIPATFRAWEQGVEYGRLLEREELTHGADIPQPRRRLTPVP